MRMCVCRVLLPSAVMAMLAGAAPAAAQFRPPSEPAVGEAYHVEAAYNWWSATPELVVSSEALGIPGSDVDLVTDLGIAEKRLPELKIVLRPARKHKFRFHYFPVNYDAQSTVQREFVFNGQRYRVGLFVNTTVDLKTYRFGYEYDFLYMDRGYLGVLLDLKYTDVKVLLDSPIGAEFTTAVAPIPTFGLVGRGYVVPNVSITGEFTFFKVPENLGGDDFGGRYFDIDFYGTVNFNDYVGAQLGYRTIDVEYLVDFDTGDFRFRGWYFGGAIRF